MLNRNPFNSNVFSTKVKKSVNNYSIKPGDLPGKIAPDMNREARIFRRKSAVQR